MWSLVGCATLLVVVLVLAAVQEGGPVTYEMTNTTDTALLVSSCPDDIVQLDPHESATIYRFENDRANCIVSDDQDRYRGCLHLGPYARSSHAFVLPRDLDPVPPKDCRS